MIHMTFIEAARLLKHPEPSPSGSFTGISIDSRTLEPGNLFIAIRGERFDGHHFVNEAIQKGAAGLVLEDPVNHPLPQFIVNHSDSALATLAGSWRTQFNIPFIGVTGSNGKTTVKNMIASILIAACQGNRTQVLAPIGTLNNHWGVPLTLSRLNKNHLYAVIEMGMNHFGEIQQLTLLTRPQVAVITNAASSHLEGVGDIAGVARAKAEIFEGLAQDGVAVLNRDDAFFDYWQQHIGKHHCLSFGLNTQADVHAVLNDTQHTQDFCLVTPQGTINIHLPLLGLHNVRNALAATAACHAIGISLKAIAAGLNTILPEKGRLQVHTLAPELHLIDDTYNANPFSLEAAVQALAQFPGKKILVLGDMKELGKDSVQIHHDLAKTIHDAGIDTLFTYGTLSAHTAGSFGKSAFHFEDQTSLIEALKPFLIADTTILVKGSRSMHMEQIINAFLPSPHSGDLFV